MRFKRGFARGLAGLVLVAAVPAEAADFLQIYRMAKQNDPEFAAARAQYQAAREAVPQARAAVLPQITFSASRFENTQESLSRTGGGTQTNSFASEEMQLELRQTLFDWNQFAGLGLAEARVAQAEAELAAAEQDLIVRVAEAYFDVLSARDTLRFARAEKRAIERQLEQAQERFEVGLIPITDVKEAQARFDLAVSREIEAENALENAREALRTLIGEPPGILSGVAAELELRSPEPASPRAWVDTALEQNPSYLAARSGAEVARIEIRQARSGHYPRVDLVARHTDEETVFAGDIPSDTQTDSIGIELTIPLFSGGATVSATRSARSDFEAAQARVLQAQRSTERNTRNAFRGIGSSISQVRALAQAVESNRTAVEATRSGFRVGTRTAVDVLSAVRDLYQAQRDHADARYQYIVNRLQLKRAAGTLTVDEVRLINSWLGDEPAEDDPGS